MTLNSEHRTEKLKSKDTETRKTRTQKDKNLILQTNRYKMQIYVNPC